VHRLTKFAKELVEDVR